MTKTNNKQNWAIILFTIGVFMAALDNGIISTALTTINSSFEVSTSWGAWGITLYTLGLAVSVPIVGKLSGRYGRKKLFIIEVILFGIGSLLVALSQSFPMFLISRLIQAFGGGGIFIIGSAHILSTLPKEKQGKALGILGGMNGIAAVLGPNIGSFLLDLTGSWHWLFLINLPIAIALIVLGTIFIVETKAPTTKPLDFIGTVILSLAILGLMLGITNLDSSHLANSMTNPAFFGFVLAGIAFFILLIVYENKLEKKGGDPILAYSLLKNKVFQWTLVIGLFSGGLIAAVIFIPAYVELYLGVPATKAGYWMTPLALASGVGAGLGGVFVDKKGPIKTIIIAGIVAFIGFLLFPIWVVAKWQFLIASIIAGAGFGFLLGAPLNVLVSESAGDNKGSALGTLSLVRQIGLTIGPTIYASFITAGVNQIGPNIATKLKEANIPMPEGNHSMPNDMAAFQQQLEMIPDPEMKSLVMSTIQETMGKAFGNLYLTAAIISALVLVSVAFLAKFRKSIS